MRYFLLAVLLAPCIYIALWIAASLWRDRRAFRAAQKLNRPSSAFPRSHVTIDQ